MSNLKISPEIRQAIRVELTQSLYDNFYLSFFSLLVAIIGIFWELSFFLDRRLLINWCVIALLILMSRLILTILYHIKNSSHLTNYFFYFFFIGSSLTALSWGVLGSVLMPNDTSSQLLVLAVIAVIVGGGIQALRASYIASILYVLLSLVPMLVWFYLEMLKTPGSSIYSTTFFLILGYCIFLTISAHNAFNHLIQTLKLKLENIDLFNNLTRSKNDLGVLIETTLDGVWYVNEHFEIIYLNKRLAEMLGYSLDEVVGKSVFSFLDDESRVTVMKHLAERFKTFSKDPVQYEIKMLKKDGGFIWGKMVVAPQYENGTKKIKFLGIVSDVTEQKIADETIRKSEEKYRLLVEQSPYGIFILLDEKISFINEAMIKILNGENESQFIGKSIFDLVHPSYVNLIKSRILDIKLKQQPNKLVREILITLDGKEKLVEAVSIPFEFQNKPAAQVIVHDITARIQAENRLSYLSSHDQKTGLANRRSLDDALNQYISKAKKYPNQAVLIVFINIDRFKNINNTLGLYVGDLLLQAVAKKLKKHVRITDILGRLEGDQFVLIYSMSSVNFVEISRKIKAINLIMNEPFIIQDKTIYITVSMGISSFPRDGKDPETLLKNADIALRYAKEKGGNNFQFCTYDLKNRVSTSRALEDKLHQAISRKEFYLEYQPKISVKTGEVVDSEALIRWKDPVSGENIPPADFIPLAEEIGLISPITDIVLRLIAKQMVKWKTKNFPIFRVAINLSSYNFQEINLIKLFNSVLQKYKLDANLFEIEITESAFFQSIADNIEVLTKFKNMGIKIAIDDFGIGYSSLSYLQDLEIDSLKIDQSFIKNIISNPNNQSLVSTIIDMAHTLGIEVIAEGVETEGEFTFLREHNCDIVQGFYFSKPLTARNLMTYINSDRSPRF